LGEIVHAVEKVLPAIGSDASAVDVVRIPKPAWVQDGRIEGESGCQGGRVVESEIGAEPVEDSDGGWRGGKGVGHGGVEGEVEMEDIGCDCLFRMRLCDREAGYLDVI